MVGERQGICASSSPGAGTRSRLRESVGEAMARFLPEMLYDSLFRQAAVALVVHRQNDRLGIWLIERASTLRVHPGEWALPGGRVEPGESVVDAALRELAEELTAVIDPRDVLGRLDDVVTDSGFIISPVVCWIDGHLIARANPAEVAAVHFVTLEELLVKPSFAENSRCDPRTIKFPVGEVIIEAPTGAILYQFAEVALRTTTLAAGSIEHPEAGVRSTGSVDRNVCR